MTVSRLGVLVLAAALIAPALASAADRKLVVGIPPLDVASIDGVDESASVVLAKLIRIEMIKSVRLQPVLMDAASPDADASTTDATKGPAKTDVVLKGTVLSADASQSSKNLTSPSFLGGNLSVGGHVGRTTATVALHIELVNAAGDTVDSFDVESKVSEIGIGTDLQTAVGSYNSGDASFDKSPMGKALRGAAQKVAAEMTKRADKLTPRS